MQARPSGPSGPASARDLGWAGDDRRLAMIGYEARTPQRGRFLLLPLAAVLLPLLMVGVEGWLSWKSTWAEAELDLQRTADAGGEYVSRLLLGYQVAVGRINDATLGLSDQQIREQERELHTVLRRLVMELPLAYTGYVVDREGFPLVGANLYPVPRGKALSADREFFLALAAPSAPEVHVSKVYLSRVDDKPFFALSRRRTGTGNGRPASEFDGLVNVSVSPRVVGEGMQRLLHDATDFMTLIRNDGEVLARTAGMAAPMAPVQAGSPFYPIVASPTGKGTYAIASDADGNPRLGSVRRVDGFPLSVLATRLRAEIVLEWRRQMEPHLIFGIPATLALLALSLLVRRSQLRLADHNAGLERALGQSDAWLRRVQIAGGVRSFEVGADGQVACDDEFRLLWGAARGSRLNIRMMVARLHPDDRLSAQAELTRLATLGGSFNTEARVLRPDDSVRWLMLLGEAAPGGNGLPARIVGVAMDITARKETEAAVQANEQRLRDLVETLDLATVLVCDMAGRITFWSEGCALTFGWDAAEAIGQAAAELLRTALPVPQAEIDAALMAKGIWTGDLGQTRRDGSQLTVAVRRVLRHDATGRAVAVMESFADVTALRQTQSELEQVNQSLESLVRDEVAKREAAQARAAHAERIQVLGQLAGGIAHDLNNVLQAVTSGASLTMRDAEKPDRVRRLARLITEAAQRGVAVTGRLLSFSRRADLRAEPLDPRGVLTDIWEVLAHTLGGHVTCEIDAPVGLPRLLADRGQLETALVNLATNARDALANGGTIVLAAAADMVVDQATHPSGAAPGRYIRLSIADKGAGMDKATLARVTEPFFTTKQEGRGTGLGLAMVNGFAAQSGGALAIDSAPGVGTTVSLWLPEAGSVQTAGAGTAGAGIRPPAMNGRAGDPTGSARVLLVDDDAMVREPMAQQLEAAGYRLCVAEDGPGALAQLDACLVDGVEPVDVLVCDLSMPGMGGLEVIREAQRRQPGLPAILMTGYVGDAAALPVDGARFALLRKPVSVEEVSDIIAILLAGNGEATHLSVGRPADPPIPAH